MYREYLTAEADAGDQVDAERDTDDDGESPAPDRWVPLPANVIPARFG